VSAITDEKIMATLREVVAERPEFIYQKPPASEGHIAVCRYVHGDVPGCLIGHVLHRLGVSLETLSVHEGQPAQYLAGTLDIGGDAVRWALGAAQEAQDGGSTWHEALACAEREFAA
jgi:hypothetical protein